MKKTDLENAENFSLYVFIGTLVVLVFLIGAVLVQAASISYVSQTINSAPLADGTWSSALSPYRNDPSGHLNIYVYGAAWSGTVTLQRRLATTAGYETWADVRTWTANTQKALVDPEPGAQYRIGIKNGAYTSGSVYVRLSCGIL